MIVVAVVLVVVGIVVVVSNRPVESIMRRVGNWTLPKDSEFAQTPRPGATIVGGIGGVCLGIFILCAP